jgi:tRNA modification GTPase
MLEFHIHGGPATVKAVLSAISRCKSNFKIRYAEPGEFTRRAFQNDRLDLAQVEALSDTLSAETEQQRRAAVRGNSGALGRTYERWRQQLLEARGELEALIDFSEDHDFSDTDPDLLNNVRRDVKSIMASIRVHEEASRRGEMLRKGIRISMLGPPNVGKSSLLNRIVGREASIVSTEAGTTRDVVEVSLDIEGYLCTFADTAGLRSSCTRTGAMSTTVDIIGMAEQEGIRRAKAKAAESDLIIVMASVEPSEAQGGWRIQCDAEALDLATKAGQYVVVVNKTDVLPKSLFQQALEAFKSSLPSIPNDKIIPISCKMDLLSASLSQDPGNIAHLISHLATSFKCLTTLGDEDLYGVTERQRQLLSACDQYLAQYLAETDGADMAELEFDLVVAAEHLRAAAACLSRLTGRGEAGDVEEVLGVVFEK